MNGTVLRTSAAGSSWEETPIPMADRFQLVSLFSRGVLGLQWNQMVYTTDGGQSWAAFEGAGGNSTYTDMVAVEGPFRQQL